VINSMAAFGKYVATVAARLDLLAIVLQHGIEIAAARRVRRLRHAAAPMNQRFLKALIDRTRG